MIKRRLRINFYKRFVVGYVKHKDIIVIDLGWINVHILRKAYYA